MTTHFSRYAKVFDGIWDDEVFNAFSHGTKLVWLYLLTGNKQKVPGVFPTTIAKVAEGMNLDVKVAEKALLSIEKVQRLRMNDDFIWLPNALKHNFPQNPSVVAGWKRSLQAIPCSPLLIEAIAYLYWQVQGKGQQWIRAFYSALTEDQAYLLRVYLGSEKCDPLPPVLQRILDIEEACREERWEEVTIHERLRGEYLKLQEVEDLKCAEEHEKRNGTYRQRIMPSEGHDVVHDDHMMTQSQNSLSFARPAPDNKSAGASSPSGRKIKSPPRWDKTKKGHDAPDSGSKVHDAGHDDPMMHPHHALRARRPIGFVQPLRTTEVLALLGTMPPNPPVNPPTREHLDSSSSLKSLENPKILELAISSSSSVIQESPTVTENPKREEEREEGARASDVRTHVEKTVPTIPKATEPASDKKEESKKIANSAEKEEKAPEPVALGPMLRRDASGKIVANGPLMPSIERYSESPRVLAEDALLTLQIASDGVYRRMVSALSLRSLQEQIDTSHPRSMTLEDFEALGIFVWRGNPWWKSTGRDAPALDWLISKDRITGLVVDARVYCSKKGIVLGKAVKQALIENKRIPAEAPAKAEDK